MNGKLLPLLLGALLSLGAVALGFALGKGLTEQALFAARWTARAGFPIFIMTYSASSLARIWPNPSTKALLRHRRQWGLGFAFAHTVHLAALLGYLSISQSTRPAIVIAGGGGAYVLLYAMALTSNDAAQRALGIWWKRLHRLGIHWLWFIFAFSYLGRVSDPDRMMQGLILFPACIAALGLRLWAWGRARRSIAAG